MNFYNPWGFLGLVSIPVIILMYILKQKYEEKKVPSLFLWEKALSYSEAYKPWQKLRKNILLFLQLIIAFLLVLILANPYIAGGMSKSGSYIIVLDQSITMQAKDESPNRFEEAKNKIYQMINSLEPSAKISVVVMGKEPYILVNQSTDNNAVIKRIEDVKLLNSGIDLENTESLVKAIYENVKSNIYIFSDKEIKFTDLNSNLIKIGKNYENCGITLLSHSKEEKQIAALVRVKNFGTQMNDFTVSLYGDEKLIDIKRVQLQANEEKNVFFTGISREVNILKAQIDVEDILEVDNTMYDVVYEDAKEKVLLLTNQNVFLEQILSLLPQVELYKGDLDNIENLQGYYLYIFDGLIPDSIPEDGHILVFNPPVSNPLINVENDIEVTSIYSSGGALLEFIDQIKFDIAVTKKMSTPSWGQVVLNSEETPLIIAGERGEQKVIVFGFDLHQTDLPVITEFPIFIYNTIKWFIPEKIHNLEKVAAGDTIEFQISPESKEVSIVKPGGEFEKLAPPFPVQPYNNTNEIGIYTLRQKGEKIDSFHYFAVNPVVEWDFNSNNTVDNEENIEEISQANDLMIETNKNLKNIFLMILLLFIAVEWWVFVRGN